MLALLVAQALDEPIATEVEPFIGFDWEALLGFLTVFITAVVSRSYWSDTVKGAISSVTIALVSLVVMLLEGGDFTWEEWANQSLQILVVHLGSWLLLLKEWAARVNVATDPGNHEEVNGGP